VLETFKFVDSQRKEGQQVVMNGNESLAYGLIAAGIRFGAGYPITPWSSIMEILRAELPRPKSAALVSAKAPFPPPWYWYGSADSRCAH